ncbi:MAG TPA: OmpP1/FadL family transporter [Beijerinckiaceae bacterium]|nr:OmpP1/FadL family transporter [Beijerinckiaceae bacterium]
MGGASNFRNFLLGACAIGSLALATVSAEAGGFANRQQSATGQGFSFAGAGTSAFGLGSMFWNPANITNFEGRRSEWNVSMIAPDSRVDTTSAGFGPAALQPLNAFVTGRTGSSGNINQTAVAPASYNSYQYNDWLWLGLVTGTPFGNTTKPSNGFAGSVYGTSTKIKTLAATPTIGIKINDWISVGFGFTVQHARVDLKSGDMRYWPAIALAPALFQPNLYRASAPTRLEGDAWGFGVTAGVTLKPWAGGEVSLGYRSMIHHALKGSISAYGPTLTTTGQLIKANLNLPEMITLGLKQDINAQWTVTATAQWTNWSRLQAPPIINRTTGALVSNLGLRYRDEWFLAAGAQYNWSPNLALRAGVAYEISPITDETRGVRVLDNNRLWLSAGLGYKVSNRLELDLGYSFLLLESGKVNIVAAGNPLNPAGNPSYTAFNYTGNSKGHGHVLAASLKYRWDEPANAPIKPVVAKN